MDERLSKALEFSNYMVTLNNQKRVLKEKYYQSAVHYFSGGQFSVTQELITFVSMLVSKGNDADIVLLDDNDTPIIPTDDDPLPDIDLPDLSFFVNGFDLSTLVLPETVTFIEDSVPPDLSDLIGLLGDQGESLALDFDQIDTDAPVIASIETVKPVIVDWTSHPDPFIDSDWNVIIEELYNTAEFV